MMEEWMKEAFFTLFLVMTAAADWRWRKIPVWMFLFSGICGAVLWMAVPGDGLESHEAFAALVPGGFSLLLTGISRGSIGVGDGCFLLAAACYLRWEKVWTLWMGGLLCCSLGSLFLIVKGRFRGNSVRKLRIPFLPFLVPVWILMNWP